MARRRRGRPLNGILLLDKPQGISSNKALQIARAIYFAQKAGHTGSLDPLATGMLPVCFGEATKFSQFLLDSDKSYFATGKLGIITDSGDADGQVIAESEVNVTEAQLLQTLEAFKGDIEQVPSMFSALKKDGQPLYKLARQGIEVERAARPVSIYQLDLIDFNKDEFSIRVRCSKGTYIRSLVEDIGKMLGCGAHVAVLRRESVAGFEKLPMTPLNRLEELKQQGAHEELDSLLLPVDAGIDYLEKVELDKDSAYYFLQGNPVNIGTSMTGDATYRVYEESSRFLGVAQVNQDGLLAPKRIISQN